jgi:hypothetical protein
MTGKIIGGLVAISAVASQLAAAAILPTGVAITPEAIPGARLESFDPRLASLPDYRASQPVSIRLSMPWHTALCRIDRDSGGRRRCAASQQC